MGARSLAPIFILKNHNKFYNSMQDTFNDNFDIAALTVAFANQDTDYDAQPFHLDVVDYNHACRF